MKRSASYLSFPQILSRLMADKAIKERDIVNATGIPQSTLSNILRGKSKNPNYDTLRLLARFFELNIDQLMGYEPLETALPSVTAESFLSKKTKKAPSLAPVTIPLLNWNEIKDWISGNRGIKAYTAWLANDICKNPKAFALKAKPSMRSHFFSPNATLLVEPQYLIEDSAILLVCQDGSEEFSLKLLTIDGSEKWLNSLEKDKPAIKLTAEHCVIGTVVEARFKPGIQ